jgi:hypothetical protein
MHALSCHDKNDVSNIKCYCKLCLRGQRVELILGRGLSDLVIPFKVYVVPGSFRNTSAEHCGVRMYRLL